MVRKLLKIIKYNELLFLGVDLKTNKWIHITLK